MKRAYPNLSKAPIIEGLLNIQVKARPDLTLKEIANLRDALNDRYPESKDLRTIIAGVRVSADRAGSQSVTTELVGYRLERKDKPFVLLLANNGLTVSRLKPYDKWEDLVAEAKPIWEKYIDFCKPETVTRIATRYINRLELPAQGLDFDAYLAAMPRLPKKLPDTLADFLVRLVVPDKETGCHAAIVQAFQGVNTDANTVQVLIDIDVFKTVDMQPASQDIWKLLDIMRNLKNDAFFGAITDKTLELLR
jgi:uncharacterized protein (TIGR04255 family)